MCFNASQNQISKSQNIHWFRLLKCEDLLLFFVIYDVNEESLGLLVGQKKQFEDVTLGSVKFLFFFLTFYRRTFD